MLHNCCWNMVPKENETVAQLKNYSYVVFAGPSFVISSSRLLSYISYNLTTVNKILIKHSVRQPHVPNVSRPHEELLESYTSTVALIPGLRVRHYTQRLG